MEAGEGWQNFFSIQFIFDSMSQNWMLMNPWDFSEEVSQEVDSISKRLDLRKGEMLHGKEFSLYEVMSAVEVMDPKMDLFCKNIHINMEKNNVKGKSTRIITVPSFQERLFSGCLKISRRGRRKTILLIMDELLKALVYFYI